ncbi:MAG: ATP-binding protein [Acutalibacteraceae bacterium]|nr:ATP-binding protein [Acutalibacteraceae bacterium]
MELFQWSRDIFMYSAEAAVFLFYAKSFFTQKYKTPVTVSGVGLAYAILFLIYKLNIPALNLVAIPTILTFAFLLIFNCNLKSALIHSAILLVSIGTTETLTMSFNAAVFDVNMSEHIANPIIYTIDIVFSKMAYSAVVMSIAYIFSQTHRKNKNNKVFWLLFISPISSIFVNTVFFYFDKLLEFTDGMYVAFCVASFILLVTNIIVFFVYSYSLRNTTELYELKMEAEKQAIDSQYLQIIEQNNKNSAIFIHDIKNHLQHIKSLNNSEEIHSYIESISEEVQSYGYIGMSKNKTLDLLISKYLNLCQGKGIKIDFDVKTANLNNVAPTDISTIINNLLDNAVESAEQSQKKAISVSIFKKQGFEILKVQNGCDTKPQTKNGNLLTTKKEKQLHGYGTQSVIKTINKYDGMFDWEYSEKEKLFTVTVAVPIE